MMNVLLASAGEDVRLWQTPDLSLVSVKNGTNANVTYCSCSGNGQLVAYAHEDEGLNVASLHDESTPIIQIPTACEQSSVVFNSSSRYLLSGGNDCVINIWDIKSRSIKRSYKDHDHPVTFCLFDHNDNTIASSSDHGEILLTNVKSGISTELLDSSDTQAVRALGYSYFNRSLLASASDSGGVCLWDAKANKLLKTFTNHKAPATGITFSPLNDMLLCSTGLDRRLIFYDVTGQKTVKTINTEGPVTCCDFMHDGCTVAVGTAAGRLYMFDLRHGSTPIAVIPGHKTSVRSVSFQKIPKPSKSPKRPIEETKAFDRVQEEPNEGKQRDKDSDSVSSDPLSSSRDIVMTPKGVSRSTSNLSREGSSSNMMGTSQGSSTNLMGGRENSTMALNYVLNQNKTPDFSSLPPKAAKLIGDEIFTPILNDPTVSKKPVLRLKSSNKLKDNVRPQSVSVDTDEPMRPGFFRSKSGGLSKFATFTRSTDDLSMKKHKESDKEDGKKSGLLNFKSPFKKKHQMHYNKHSDESETSSIDSFGIIDEKEKYNTLGTRRGKKDRLSDRSNDSGGRPQEIVRQIDPHQLSSDIQNSLLVNGERKSPSVHSGESVREDNFHFDNVHSNTSISQFQVDFIQRMIDEAMEENRSAVHGDMVNLQVEMLRQMEIQKEQIRQMMQHYSINDELVSEIDRLRAENERLRTKY